MEYRILGKTGLKVSRLGFGGIPIQRIEKTDAKALIDALIANGINYIDSAKAYTVSEEWIGYGMEGNRDKFILATKSMSRDYAGMKADIESSLKAFRTDYIDLYQIHNVTPEQMEQVCGENGALKALMEAKEEGKIGHIGVTAHSAATFEMIFDLPWVETFMFPYNIVETQCKHLIDRCKEANIGFIDMKPLAGGAIENAPLALKFLFADDNVDLIIPGMYCVEEVEQNTAAALADHTLTDEDKAGVEEIRAALGENFCRRCNYCAPCAKGISIPNVFLFAGYLERYGLEGWARERYATLPAKASDCIQCGLCEPRCPYHLPIREMMKRCAAEFGE